MAMGLVQELARAGIEVPSQIAVVGFDDIFASTLVQPPLTSVRQPMRALGQRACERLLVRNGAPDQPLLLEVLGTELVIRESCGCKPCAIETASRVEKSGSAGEAGPGREASPGGKTNVAGKPGQASRSTPRPARPSFLVIRPEAGSRGARSSRSAS